MKLEGVTAFKIRPCVSRLNGIMDPALDAKTVGELVDNGGEIYIESIPCCRGLQTIHSELDNGVHQSRVRLRTLATCHGFENLPLSPKLEIFVTKIPTSAFTASVKNWDERQLLCVAYHVFGVRLICIAY